LIGKDYLSGGLELILDLEVITFPFLVRLFMAVSQIFKVRSNKGLFHLDYSTFNHWIRLWGGGGGGGGPKCSIYFMNFQVN